MKIVKKEELLDKKILYQHYPANKFAVMEGKIKEFSPSGHCVKIDKDWFLLDNIKIVEVFKEEERPGLGFKVNRE